MVPLLEKIGAAFAEYVFFISLYQKKKKKKDQKYFVFTWKTTIYII